MKPNVLLVILDTVRASSCSLYGCDRPTTPGLAKIAKEGVRFDHAIAPSTWTLPSHAAMFTGEYPLTIGVHAENMVLPDHKETVAESLQNEGYETGIFSSNPFLTEGSGLNKGFGRSHTSKLRLKLFNDGFDPANYIRSRKHEHGLSKVMELAEELAAPPRQFAKNVLNAAHYKYRTNVSGGNQDSYDPAEDDGVAESIEAFEKWVQTTERPFFGCLNFMEAHTPYRHREQFLPDSVDRDEVANVNQDRWMYLGGELELTDWVKTILQALYEAEIRYLDDQLRELWATLRSAGLWDDTLVIITSDHGELVGEHDLLYHDMNRLYEQLVHVPLLVKYPGGRHSSTTVESTVSLTQIADTIREETVGAESNAMTLAPDVPNPKLVKTDFVGMNQTLPDERYAEVYEDLASQSRAVYEGGTKYILYEDRATVVQNLPVSPSDSTEIPKDIDFGEVPEHVRKFAAIDHTVERGTDLEMDDAVKDRLGELGYR